MTPYYTIDMATDSVAEDLSHGTDHSTATIRCAINDRLDAASRDGYRVCDHYDQGRSVKLAKAKIIIEIYQRHIQVKNDSPANPH